MNIGPLAIGPDHPCRAVAEMSNAHNGSLDRADRIISAAKQAGADAMKVQAYTPDDLVALRGDGPAPDPWGADGWTMRDLYAKARTPLEWFPELAAHCDDVGLPWFASVFGPDGLAAMEALGCPAYKLAALDQQHAGLLAAVKTTGKPIIRSGNTDSPPAGDLALWCPPNYPQTTFDLRAMLTRYHGFSYHGTDPFVPAIAAAHGAQLVEVHFQLDNEPSELEANVSLTATQFREMVGMIRKVEAIC